MDRYQRYREKNREKIRERDREWKRNKYESDLEYREEILKRGSEYSKNNRETINSASRLRREKNKQDRINYLGGKCVGCGTTQDLQFDHIDRTLKEYNISKKPDYTLDKIKPELDKCRLLCKSCHIVKTRVNNDHEQMLKGYDLQSITREDNRITIVYEVH